MMVFGVLAIDKPAGVTSRDAVNRIQRICRPLKVGHTGTLDPLATGVLLIAIGQATRLVEFSHELPKAYEAEFRLGYRSDTLDVEGQIEQLEPAVVPSRAELIAAANNWIGQVQQVPPKYSAINLKGKRAYELARQGQEFQLPARSVEIRQITLVAYDYPRFTIQVECGSGTYIRSLGSDIAREVGTDAIMSRLVRTAIGPITLQACVPLDEIGSATDLSAHLQPPNILVAHWQSVVLLPEDCKRIRNGIPIPRDILLSATDSLPERLAAVDTSGQLVAILQAAEHGLYRSLRVFQVASETSQPRTSKTPQIPES